MKMKAEHYQQLEMAIKDTLATHNKDNRLVDSYRKGEFHNSDKVKDLQKRFCYDVLYGSGLSSFVCGTLYEYLNDEHIYTALKKICPSVN